MVRKSETDLETNEFACNAGLLQTLAIVVPRLYADGKGVLPLTMHSKVTRSPDHRACTLAREP